MNPENQGEPELRLSATDIDRAIEQQVISREDGERLLKWGYDQRFDRGPRIPADRSPETARGFNLVTIAYYFGAMLMISACAWFLGDKWEELGSAGILGTTLAYALIATGVGLWLR